MNYYHVCPVGVVAGAEDLLTYESIENISIGTVVEIPFGKKTKIGVLMTKTAKPSFKTRAITRSLEAKLPQHLVKLALWMSEYYGVRLSLVLQTMLPRGIEKNRRSKEHITAKRAQRAKTTDALNEEQQQAMEAISKSKEITHVLYGVTGSGKTRVYQELARETLARGESVIILVPEISLTPQLAAEFEGLHKNILVQHSGLSEAQRHIQWQTLCESHEPWILVGPRSTLFSPLSNIGLIVVDECHEPSYQQDSQPKYSALRVGRKLAELSTAPHAKLILGSATPLVADYFTATKLGTPIHQLVQPATERNTLVEVVDVRDKSQFGTHPLFSKKLLESMNNAIAQSEQVLLFHNRRGTARMCLCSNCGWVAECQTCHIPLRLHHDKNELRCHVCGRQQPIPQTCPSCGNVDVDFKGFGSKRIEAEVKKLFPTITVARFDSDTPVKEQLQHRYQELYDGKIQIIIGTQGIAKGLDLPHLNTVGIVQADSELFIPDYSSSERSFQLTTQVIGRAGRTGAKSQVIIQTLNADHPAIEYAKKQDFLGFFEHELTERKAEHMPPYTYILQLSTGYASQKNAEAAAVKLKSEINRSHPNVFIRGPAPAFHEHRGKLFYQQLIVSSQSRSTLVKIVKTLPQRWQFTLDPISLL